MKSCYKCSFVSGCSFVSDALLLFYRQRKAVNDPYNVSRLTDKDILERTACHCQGYKEYKDSVATAPYVPNTCESLPEKKEPLHPTETDDLITMRQVLSAYTHLCTWYELPQTDKKLIAKGEKAIERLLKKEKK